MIWQKPILTDKSPDFVSPEKRIPSYWESTLFINGKYGSGNYTCEAVNTLGRNKSHMILTVGPRPPYEVSDDKIHNTLVVLTVCFGITILVMGVVTKLVIRR